MPALFWMSQAQTATHKMAAPTAVISPLWMLIFNKLRSTDQKKILSLVSVFCFIPLSIDRTHDTFYGLWSLQAQKNKCMSVHTEWDAGLSVAILLGRHAFHQNCAPNSLPGVKGIRTNVQSVYDRLNFHGGSVCLIPFEILDLEVCLIWGCAMCQLSFSDLQIHAGINAVKYILIIPVALQEKR